MTPINKYDDSGYLKVDMGLVNFSTVASSCVVAPKVSGRLCNRESTEAQVVSSTTERKEGRSVEDSAKENQQRL